FFLLFVVFSAISSQTFDEIEHVLESSNEVIALPRVLRLISKYWPELVNENELEMIIAELTDPSTDLSPLFDAKSAQYEQFMLKKLDSLSEESKLFVAEVLPKLESIVDGMELTTANELIAVLKEISNVAHLHFSNASVSVQEELESTFPFIFYMYQIRRVIFILLKEHEENVKYFLEHVDV
ncbi:hypothetical protein PFISCL1PPCAC_1422, partial [Pristionchus fissidentatus]